MQKTAFCLWFFSKSTLLFCRFKKEGFYKTVIFSTTGQFAL